MSERAPSQNRENNQQPQRSRESPNQEENVLKEILFELPPCVICLEQLSQNIYAQRCGHVFHQTCIKTNLRMNTKCPICKKQNQQAGLKLYFSSVKREFLIMKSNQNAEESIETLNNIWKLNYCNLVQTHKQLKIKHSKLQCQYFTKSIQAKQGQKLKNQLKECNKNIQIFKQSEQNLKINIQELKNQISKKSSLLCQKQELIKTHKKQNQKRIDKINSENKLQIDKIKGKNQIEIKDLKTKFQEVRKQKQIQIQNLKDRNQQVERQKLKNQNNLKKYISQLEKQLEQCYKNIQDYEQSQENLQNQINELNQIISEKDKIIEQKQAQFEQIKKQNWMNSRSYFSCTQLKLQQLKHQKQGIIKKLQKQNQNKIKVLDQQKQLAINQLLNKIKKLQKQKQNQIKNVIQEKQLRIQQILHQMSKEKQKHKSQIEEMKKDQQDMTEGYLNFFDQISQILQKYERRFNKVKQSYDQDIKPNQLVIGVLEFLLETQFNKITSSEMEINQLKQKNQNQSKQIQQFKLKIQQNLQQLKKKQEKLQKIKDNFTQALEKYNHFKSNFKQIMEQKLKPYTIQLNLKHWFNPQQIYLLDLHQKKIDENATQTETQYNREYFDTCSPY